MHYSARKLLQIKKKSSNDVSARRGDRVNESTPNDSHQRRAGAGQPNRKGLNSPHNSDTRTKLYSKGDESTHLDLFYQLFERPPSVERVSEWLGEQKMAKGN